MTDPMPAIRDILSAPVPRPKTEAEIVAEALGKVKADLHPGHMGTGSYSHILACLTHVAGQYGVEL